MNNIAILLFGFVVRAQRLPAQATPVLRPAVFRMLEEIEAAFHVDRTTEGRMTQEKQGRRLKTAALKKILDRQARYVERDGRLKDGVSMAPFKTRMKDFYSREAKMLMKELKAIKAIPKEMKPPALLRQEKLARIKAAQVDKIKNGMNSVRLLYLAKEFRDKLIPQYQQEEARKDEEWRQALRLKRNSVDREIYEERQKRKMILIKRKQRLAKEMREKDELEDGRADEEDLEKYLGSEESLSALSSSDVSIAAASLLGLVAACELIVAVFRLHRRFMPLLQV